MKKEIVLQKAEQIEAGQEVVLSMREYDYLVDVGRFGNSWASLENPSQRNTWFVADIRKAGPDSRVIQARRTMGIS